MKRYTVLLLPDVVAGGYTVTVPALPGCITEGDTLDEAMANAREAVALHVESLIASGEPLPGDDLPPTISFVDIG